VELVEAVRTRRSVLKVTDAAPSDDEVRELVALAASGPDHAALRPWRLVLMRGEARSRLGAAFAAAHDDSDSAAKAAAKPLRAPLLVGIVFRPTADHPKAPEWEQLIAAAGVAVTLQLLLHDRGWMAAWRSGKQLDEPPVRDVMGLAPGERLLGWLYVGAPKPDHHAAPRRPIDVDEFVTTLPQ
jgi:nitroreductase